MDGFGSDFEPPSDFAAPPAPAASDFVDEVRDESDFDDSDFEGSDDRTVQIRLGGNDIALSGLRYLLDVAMPNFYFHVTTAYDILRGCGVAIGKRDFMGAI